MAENELKVEDYLNLLRKIAHSYTRTCPTMDFDDLFQEACLAFLKSYHKYDPSKGAPTTFITMVVTSSLNNMVAKERKWAERNMLYDPEFFDVAQPEYEQEWKEMLSELSPEAQYICWMVPRMEEELPKSAKKCRKIIANHLQRKRWNIKKIWKCTNEIQKMLV